jgi:hypothetical protein
MEMNGQLNERATPDTYWIEGWMGPRAGLDVTVKRKIPAPRGNLTSDVRNFSKTVF